MDFPYFIIISGPPASGKTTLGLKISDYYDIPFINKDLIKESLFETLGSSDRQTSRKLGYASIKLLQTLLEVQLKAKKSAIIESAFFSEDEHQDYQRIVHEYNVKPIEIHCFGSEKILINRFTNRDESGTRHKGHINSKAVEELRFRLKNNTYGSLGLNANIINLNVDDFSTIDFNELIRKITAFQNQN